MYSILVFIVNRMELDIVRELRNYLNENEEKFLNGVSVGKFHIVSSQSAPFWNSFLRFSCASF